MGQTWQDFPAVNWGLTTQAGQTTGGDPNAGTYAKLPDGTFQYFEPGQNPKAYLGDSIPGGSAWAVPGTDEANHLERLMKTGTNQAAIKIATLVGGGAALGAALPSFGGAAASGAGALEPVSVGASYLPGGTVGFEGAGAAGAAGAGNVAGLPALSGSLEAFPAAGGAEGLTGVTLPESASYLPPVDGYSAADLGAASMGPPSSLAGSGGWLAKLTQASKLAGQGGGQQQAATAPAMAPRASGGGAFLRRVLQPRPNYLGQFGNAVMAGQQATDLISRARRGQ